MGTGASGGVGERHVGAHGGKIFAHTGIRSHEIVFSGPGRFAGDDPYRRALGIGAEHAKRSGRNSDIDASGNHRLLGLAAARCVDDLQFKAGAAKDTGRLADFGDGRIPQAALPDGQPDEIVGKRRA